MNGCTEKLAKILDQPIRPGVVIRLADKPNKIQTPTCAILINVGLNNTGFLQSHSNGNDGTVNADFCGYGYRVDDPMYRCGSGTLTSNGGVADRFFTSQDMTPNVKFSHGLMFTTVSKFDSLSLEIAPLYSGTLTMELEDYDGVSRGTKSISNTTKIERVTFDVSSLTDGRPVYMNFTLSRGGRFAFTGTYGDDSYEELLFDNSNIVSLETYVSVDLYSQAVPNEQIKLTVLDKDHEYDPANPQGKFAKLTPDRAFYLRLGYRLPDRNGEVEWVDGSWNGSYGYYISDTPTYQDQKVTMSLQTEHWNNKTNVSVPIKHGLYGVGNEVDSRTISKFGIYPFIDTTAMIDKQAYTSGSMWNANALGKYYYRGNNFPDVTNIGTMHDYTINDNRILDGGIQLDKQPMLKNLIIKQYKNVQSELRLTQPFTISTSDYEWYAPWNKYRTRLYNSQELDISCIEMSGLLGTGIDWRIIYEDINDSGVLSTSIYATASSKIAASGSFNIYGTDSSSTDIVIRVNAEGEDMTIDNPLITSNALVVSCAEATMFVAAMREVYTVNMANDIRLQNVDCVYLDTPYEKNIPVVITGIKRVMPGIKSEITCRRLNL